MLEINKIHQGDALSVLQTFPDNSVNCCVTSPPYYNLRDYNVKGQLGLETTVEEYIDKLCNIFDEVRRVLREDGTCFVVIGDSYRGSGAGSSKKQQVKNKCKENYTIPYGSNKRKRGRDAKCAAQIPARFEIEMTNRGWIKRNTIIWWKKNAMPDSASDRFTVDFEDVFFFVKNRKYKFEQQREPYKQVSLDRIKKPWRGSLYSGHTLSSLMSGDMSKMCHPDGRNMRCVWNVNTESYSGAHFATFPKKLIERMIKAGCPSGGIVLDPFMGAGTTAIVAVELARKYVGIELNLEYIGLAKKRIGRGLSNWR